MNDIRAAVPLDAAEFTEDSDSTRADAPRREVAAVDLGSNSFHMIVVRAVGEELHKIDRIKETVRLAAGLDAEGDLDEESRLRAIECLRRFGQRVRHLPPGAVRAVGTNTLRRATAARGFLGDLEDALGHPVEIIAGREEARLIYLGVSHDLAEIGECRLVIDIGGGSTEFILGEAGDAIEAESLEMGCVTYSQRFFPGGRIDKARFRDAERHAALELQPVRGQFLARGWDRVLGSSGTLLALDRCVHALGLESEPGCSAESLRALKSRLIDAGSVDAIDLPGISEDRRPVIAGGLAVILAAISQLGLERYFPVEAALREGVIVDLLGRNTQSDVRQSTIERLQHRFAIGTAHAGRVAQVAGRIVPALADAYALTPGDQMLLEWAAKLHEIGLVLSHDRYHKHGEYMLANADLPGFSQPEQQQLAVLVRLHRRKPNARLLDAWPEPRRAKLLALAVVLRLAVLLQRSRDDDCAPVQALAESGEGALTLRFAPGWLDEHPLTVTDLDDEALLLAKVGWTLQFKE